MTHHLGRKEQNLENPILISGCRYFKVVFDSFRLHRSKCQCLWTLLLMLTKSFLPGIINLVSSSFSKKSYTMSVTVIDSVFSLTSTSKYQVLRNSEKVCSKIYGFSVKI